MRGHRLATLPPPQIHDQPLLTDADHVFHRVARAFFVAAPDFLDDADMRDRDAVDLRFIGCRTGKLKNAHQRRLDQAADRPHERIERGFQEAEVEFEICERQRVGAVAGIAHRDGKPHHPGDVRVAGAARCQCRRIGFEGQPHLAHMTQEILVDTGTEMPGEHVAVEEVPVRPGQHARADAGAGDDRPLAASVFIASRSTVRDTLKRAARSVSPGSVSPIANSPPTTAWPSSSTTSLWLCVCRVDFRSSPAWHPVPRLRPLPFGTRQVDDPLLQQDEGKEQEPDQDLRPPARKRAVERDVCLDETLDEDPDQRSGNEAGSAGEQRSADDDGGDGVQLDADGGQRVSGGG